jgi:hypothetical protein
MHTGTGGSLGVELYLSRLLEDTGTVAAQIPNSEASSYKIASYHTGVRVPSHRKEVVC